MATRLRETVPTPLLLGISALAVVAALALTASFPLGRMGDTLPIATPTAPSALPASTAGPAQPQAIDVSPAAPTTTTPAAPRQGVAPTADAPTASLAPSPPATTGAPRRTAVPDSAAPKTAPANLDQSDPALITNGEQTWPTPPEKLPRGN